MSTETQKVNVLAVLEALSLQTRQRGGCPSAPTIDDAREAVAELIEAATDALRVALEISDGPHPEFGRLAFVLGTIGGK